MSILRDFEKRLEGAVEGFVASAFRSGLQPVELAKAVQRYGNSYQQVGVEGVIVPNVYRFVLSQEDLNRFGGYTTALQRELADVISRTAAERGWVLQGPVRIEFQRGDDIRVGTYELRGKIEGPEARRSPPPPPQRPEPAPQPVEAYGQEYGGATTVLPARSSSAIIHVLDGQAPPARIHSEATLGRLPECDITLTDPSVSRRHARVAEEGGVWRITDLGSTNGIKVNGERIATSELAHGDRIELGTVRLAFSLEDR